MEEACSGQPSSLCSGSNKDISTLGWFHGDVPRNVAESLLLRNGVDGSYLIRNSSSPGEYALSVRCKDAVKHFKIQWDGREYRFGMGVFDNIQDFVQHFTSQPLIGGESGVLTVLKFPYLKNAKEPAEVFELIKMHRELPISELKPSSSIDYKDGYLTKLGGSVKSWKTRWFVLTRNELSYFKDKNDKEAIRTMLLEEARGCETDNTKDKEHCFKGIRT
ncbi:PREDICTED: dual adapter for phosphotyrosine and 3-phosphotyrosine and 3-phosphoinositide-like isoform X2 [Priapulus caudatus]|uniref:Dual adapter for phosphotyrosine and 3-phosphotyrosine and 3-phosphoinositide-like isoform X2 n=1 Tax=Priapulus caudatus TaxID=37621 RepID=A0ABM1DNY8_PRICU|nr:PREDICTED: dual adapter for phosphotyrosine and 3-phosphotyrosine and 3-phosphoinositide-like isoform X2 [Priapulus caudatus]